MITFHQAKGLEFDHVYVAWTGRNPDLGPALRTRLFSRTAVPYTITGGSQTTDASTAGLSLADREREVYVAITRPRSSVTFLYDPGLADGGYYALNPAIDELFKLRKARAYAGHPSVEVVEFTNA
jgi:ATP-dependent exoDNAse (exonuclease V) beta subunit